LELLALDSPDRFDPAPATRAVLTAGGRGRLAAARFGGMASRSSEDAKDDREMTWIGREEAAY